MTAGTEHLDDFEIFGLGETRPLICQSEYYFCG